MKYKIGEYIRIKITKFDIDFIDKILSIEEDGFGGKTIITSRSAYNYDYLLQYDCESSKHIIDLIEKNDFVNGKKVINIKNKSAYSYIKLDDNLDTLIYNRDIKCVCTKKDFLKANYVINKVV